MGCSRRRLRPSAHARRSATLYSHQIRLVVPEVDVRASEQRLPGEGAGVLNDGVVQPARLEGDRAAQPLGVVQVEARELLVAVCGDGHGGSLRSCEDPRAVWPCRGAPGARSRKVRAGAARRAQPGQGQPVATSPTGCHRGGALEAASTSGTLSHLPSGRRARASSAQRLVCSERLVEGKDGAQLGGGAVAEFGCAGEEVVRAGCLAAVAAIGVGGRGRGLPR
jgi:hypothetical protein